jgi:hypothetical protein
MRESKYDRIDDINVIFFIGTMDEENLILFEIFIENNLICIH